MKSLFSLLFLTLLAGCSLYPTNPMPAQDFQYARDPAKNLVVLLSGRGAPESYFSDHDWVDIARQFGSTADYVAPFAHYGYYVTATFLPRLQQDVMLPLEKNNYKSISVLGISMGGLGAILYTNKHPETIDRIYLISPFLGKSEVHEEIAQAGGLMQWQIKDEDKDNWNYYIWWRLKKLLSDPNTRDKVYLGFGQQDRMPGLQLLAGSLPADHVISIPGGHKDVVFTRIWEIMHERGFFKYTEGGVKFAGQKPKGG